MNLTRAQMAEDLEYLLDRASHAGRCEFTNDRKVGVSSNALVRCAYGGAEPGEDEQPHDRSDYAACVRAVCELPTHRMKAVEIAMRKVEMRFLAADQDRKAREAKP